MKMLQGSYKLTVCLVKSENYFFIFRQCYREGGELFQNEDEEWNPPTEEEEMTQLLSRMEDLRVELEEAKYKCFGYQNVSEHALEEM